MHLHQNNTRLSAKAVKQAKFHELMLTEREIDKFHTGIFQVLVVVAIGAPNQPTYDSVKQAEC